MCRCCGKGAVHAARSGPKLAPMRIALVSLHTSPGEVPGTGDAGGMNVVVAEHARALHARGHEVVIATRATTALPAGEYPFDPRRPGGPALHAISAGSPDLRKEQLPSVLHTFSAGLAALGPFDAVHAHYWLSAMAALPVAEQLGLIPACTLHTVAAEKNERLAPGDRPEPGIRLAGEAQLTRETFVVAGSRHELDSIRTHYGEPARGSEVIHPGVDTTLFAPTEGERRPGEPLRLTVLGRVQPLKGQDLAISALADLVQRHPGIGARVELVIAGEPTPGAEEYASGLRVLAARLGVSAQIRFLPRQSRGDAAALLASSAAVVIPSLSETFGLVALEAAACGVPLVVGAHTGLREAAPENVAALHVHGRNPSKWADALARLLTDAALYEQLSQGARTHALTHSWDAQAAKLEALYVSLSHSEGTDFQ